MPAEETQDPALGQDPEEQAPPKSDPEIGASLSDADLVPDQALTRAEDDRFKHSALARRVAELVTSVEPRANVGLFGSWGSGKSSLAGLIEERLEGSSTGFVYYDAWKFGGKSLRRNFISAAATELGLPREEDHWEDYHRGLYQTKRRAEIHTKELGRAARSMFIVFVLLFLGLLFLALIGLTVASLFTDENVGGEIKRTLPDYLGATGITALILAVGKAVIDVGRVDIEQSAPSDDEEFSERFSALIKEVRPKEPKADTKGGDWKQKLGELFQSGKRPPPKPTKGPYKRIVFFIDELDRCEQKEVVQTLIAVRTFLGEDHCVFVVAADRGVLETALERELEQATPIDADNPYYTTAGAFLDKIFRHQIEVPPLRGRRLTRFARDLVGDKGGVWREIVTAGGRAELDSVVYALIPAHIRSPRRVKVLLNNFATNARVAEGRGIEWPGRAQEIAKLTALQTEFPAVAADLVTEPRLLRFLLDPSHEAISERAQVVLDRHRVDEDAPENEAEDSRADPDQYLDQDETEDEGGESARRLEMRNRHRSQLLRYLERTARIDGPRRDLLYLEAAGAAVDLEDPGLGEEIEEFGPEAPDVVVASVQSRKTEEQVAAVRLLADMVQDTIADEQTNVMTAMMALVAGLGPTLSDLAADDVTKSLRLFSRDKPLSPEHLVGALSVSLRVRDMEFADKVVDTDELWRDHGRLVEVAMMQEHLPVHIRSRLWAEVGAALAEDHSVLVHPAAALPESQALELLQAEPIATRLVTYVGDGALDAAARTDLATALLAAALDPDPPRGRQLDQTVGLLLDANDQSSYEALRNRSDEVLAVLDQSSKANEFALRMWGQAEPDDWPTWSEALRGSTPAHQEEAGIASELLPSLVSRWDSLNEAQEDGLAPMLNTVVQRSTPLFDENTEHPVATELESIMGGADWADAPENRERRERLHTAARELRGLGQATWQKVDALLANDLVSALQSAGSVQYAEPTGLEAIRGVETMGQFLSNGALADVVSKLPELDPEVEPGPASAEISARCLLTREARDRDLDWKKKPFGVSPARVVAVARTDGTDVPDAVAHWLDLGPKADSLKPVAAAVAPDLPEAVEAALKRWSESSSKAQRTALAKHLVGRESSAIPWLRVLAVFDLNESSLAQVVHEKVLKSSSVETRAAVAREARALGFSNPNAGKLLAGAVTVLLRQQRAKVDIGVAALLAAAVPSAQVKKSSWESGFKRRCDQENYRLTKEEGNALQAAGIQPPKEGFGKKLRKFFGI